MKLYTARIVLSLSVLSAAVIGGCKDSGTAVLTNDQFRPDDEPRNLDMIFAQQTANGAREDGTLYTQHFTHGKLNSLGYAKLSKLTHGDADTGGGKPKLSIYLDVPKGDTYAAAQDSVIKALANAGIADDGYSITAGANPNLSNPAVQGLAGLAKQSSVAGEEGGSESGSLKPSGSAAK
jgi:hypothetical protein